MIAFTMVGRRQPAYGDRASKPQLSALTEQGHGRATDVFHRAAYRLVMSNGRLDTPSEQATRSEKGLARWESRVLRVIIFVLGTATVALSIAVLLGKVTVDDGAGHPLSSVGSWIFACFYLLVGAMVIATAIVDPDTELPAGGSGTAPPEGDLGMDADCIDFD